MSNEFQEEFWAVKLPSGRLKGPYTRYGNDMVALYSTEGTAKRAAGKVSTVLKVKLVEVVDKPSYIHPEKCTTPRRCQRCE